ncbi:unnamed protein product [Menidia menidia]|uniref:(Atlantic silverside) hypothetical protein n=1 Tax=Menidia menidia TaxID=238744 RepID=A0A8S4BPR2_9TELE|nr:unnamed protein product [Menidia menidia]
MTANRLYLIVSSMRRSELQRRWGEKDTGQISMAVMCLLVAFTLVLKLVGEQGLFGAHGSEPDLIIVIIAVLPQAVEAVFLPVGLGCTHAPDDARRHHQCRHGGRCQVSEKDIPEHTYEMRPYDLRQSIRCPKKYGETIKERKYMLAPTHDSEVWCEQRKGDPQKPLDNRYIRNAAVLPDLSDLPQSTEVVRNKRGTKERTSSDDLMIHGFTVPDYQQAYHSVVDPLLFRPSGKLIPYSFELGFTIKEHLFKELAYPTLQITELPNGKVEVTERFCVLRPTPHIEVDCKGEPCIMPLESTHLRVFAIADAQEGSKLQQQLCTHWGIAMDPCYEPDLWLMRFSFCWFVGNFQSPNALHVTYEEANSTRSPGTRVEVEVEETVAEKFGSLVDGTEVAVTETLPVPSLTTGARVVVNACYHDADIGEGGSTDCIVHKPPNTYVHLENREMCFTPMVLTQRDRTFTKRSQWLCCDYLLWQKAMTSAVCQPPSSLLKQTQAHTLESSLLIGSSLWDNTVESEAPGLEGCHGCMLSGHRDQKKQLLFVTFTAVSVKVLRQ